MTTTQPAPLLTKALAQSARQSVEVENALQALADGRTLCVSAPGGPREPDNDMVICPNCTHQFPAIPVNVQQRLSARVMSEDEWKELWRQKELPYLGDLSVKEAHLHLKGWLACARAMGAVR